MTDTKSRNRAYLLLMLALGVLPLLGAWWLFSTTRDSGPWTTTNHGRLLESGVDLPSLGLGELTASDGAWRLIVVPEPTGCSHACQQALPILRALHVRLGKDSSRVRRIMFGPRMTQESEPNGLPMQHLDLDAPLEAGVYIADPLGNLVLHYEWSLVGAPLLEDFEHLLDLSRIG